jgi:hypothetical protein
MSNPVVISSAPSLVTFSDYVFDFNRALKSEIQAARKNGGQKAFLTEGKHIGRREKWELYSFISDREITLPDDTEVRLEYQGKEHVGYIVANDGFILILGLDSYVGEIISSLVMHTNPIFLLEKLMERLSTAKEVGSINNNLAYRLLQRLDLSESGKDGSVQARQLLESISGRLGQSLEYNNYQFQAIASVLSQDISFIWGPPGTGKTKTLGLTVAALAEAGQSVLVVAHSNAAVDVAMLNIATNVNKSVLYDAGKIVRFGIIRNQDLEKYPGIHVRGLVEKQNPALISELKRLEKERRDLANQSRAENISPAQRNSLALRINPITDRLKQLTSELHTLELQLVSQAQVVTCTLSKMTIAPEVFQRQFDAVIIDEASMAFIPHCVLAATLARQRIAIFGDFRQLAPISQSEEPAALQWLHRDIFEHAGIIDRVELNQPDRRLVMLRTQYRMHPTISAVPNKFFYKQKLLDGPDVEHQAFAITQLAPSPGQAISLLDTSYMLAYCYSDLQSHSRFNPVSALIAVNLAYQIVSRTVQEGIGIITPYAAQSRLIHKMLRDLKLTNKSVKVATVHRYQGSEQNYIIFDAVEGPPREKAGKLIIGGMDSTAMRLTNVAVSRAKGKFIGIVHRNYLKTNLAKTDIFSQVFEHLATTVKPHSLTWPSGLAVSANWKLDLPGVTYYPSCTAAAKELEADLIKTKEEVAIYWPANVKARQVFGLNVLRTLSPEKVRIFISGAGQSEFSIGLKNTRIWQNRLQSTIGLIGIDRNYLWIFLSPKTDNPNYPVLRIALPETVKLLNNFWQLLPEDEGKTIGERIEAGQSPIGRPCRMCGSPMWLAEGPYGSYLRCTKCGDKKSLTKQDVTDMARLNGIMCRSCGGQMVGRKSDIGLFLGCVDYPKCNGMTYLAEFL